MNPQGNPWTLLELEVVDIRVSIARLEIKVSGFRVVVAQAFFTKGPYMNFRVVERAVTVVKLRQEGSCSTSCARKVSFVFDPCES